MANITSIQNMNISTVAFSQALSDLSFKEFLVVIKPLLVFIIGMTIYAIFVFKFYRFLARRDILQLETKGYYAEYEGFVKHTLRLLFYVLENLILIPICIFFWSIVLATLLIMLSESPNPVTILLSAASLVAAVRITAYYNENLSQDLAKMVPFALLGVFLIDASSFRVNNAVTVAKELPSLLEFLLYYLLFVTALEFILRITHAVAGFMIKKELDETDPIKA